MVNADYLMGPRFAYGKISSREMAYVQQSVDSRVLMAGGKPNPEDSCAEPTVVVESNLNHTFHFLLPYHPDKIMG